MTDCEILFGKRITELRRAVAELESNVRVIASLQSYSPAMDVYDLRATVCALSTILEAAQRIMTKLEQNRS